LFSVCFFAFFFVFFLKKNLLPLFSFVALLSGGEMAAVWLACCGGSGCGTGGCC
jgi:hypothetical protein